MERVPILILSPSKLFHHDLDVTANSPVESAKSTLHATSMKAHTIKNRSYVMQFIIIHRPTRCRSHHVQSSPSLRPPDNITFTFANTQTTPSKFPGQEVSRGDARRLQSTFSNATQGGCA
eukprot:scaffold29269_cov94-Skeletonema_dohrnii-CCMP3373.AAC.1